MYYKTLSEASLRRLIAQVPMNMTPSQVDISQYRPDALPPPFQMEELQGTIETLEDRISELEGQLQDYGFALPGLPYEEPGTSGAPDPYEIPGKEDPYQPTYDIPEVPWDAESSGFSDNGKKPEWWDFDLNQWKALEPGPERDKYVQDYQNNLSKAKAGLQAARIYYRIPARRIKSSFRIPRQ